MPSKHIFTPIAGTATNPHAYAGTVGFFVPGVFVDDDELDEPEALEYDPDAFLTCSWCNALLLPDARACDHCGGPVEK